MAPREARANERDRIIRERRQYLRPAPIELTGVIDQTSKSKLLTEPIQAWWKYVALEDNMKVNVNLRLPKWIETATDESDDEQWVGASTEGCVADSEKPIKEFNLMAWYVNQVRMHCAQVFDGSDEGRR